MRVKRDASSGVTSETDDYVNPAWITHDRYLILPSLPCPSLLSLRGQEAIMTDHDCRRNVENDEITKYSRTAVPIFHVLRGVPIESREIILRSRGSDD